MKKIPARLVLEDVSQFEGFAFGYLKAVSGEVFFNPGMVDYPESLLQQCSIGLDLTTVVDHLKIDSGHASKSLGKNPVVSWILLILGARR